MNKQALAVMDRFETITLEMAKINHANLQPRTYDRFRKELDLIKADLRRAFLEAGKPSREEKKAQPIKSLSDKEKD